MRTAIIAACTVILLMFLSYVSAAPWTVQEQAIVLENVNVPQAFVCTLEGVTEETKDKVIMRCQPWAAKYQTLFEGMPDGSLRTVGATAL